MGEQRPKRQVYLVRQEGGRRMFLAERLACMYSQGSGHDSAWLESSVGGEW